MSAGPAQVDPRGPRFAAWVTTVVLATVLVTGWWPLLAAQAVVFAVGAVAGFGVAPYSVLYRTFVAPRLGPTGERDDTAPLRFAQGVGFGFAVLGVLGYATGVPELGIVATAFALAAAVRLVQTSPPIPATQREVIRAPGSFEQASSSTRRSRSASAARPTS